MDNVAPRSLEESGRVDSATEVFWHSGALQIGLLLLLLLDEYYSRQDGQLKGDGQTENKMSLDDVWKWEVT